MFHLNWVEPLSKFVGGLPESTRLDLSWAEAPIKIARMTLTIKLDGNWSSFQLANSAPPLSVTDGAIAPSARMEVHMGCAYPLEFNLCKYQNM